MHPRIWITVHPRLEGIWTTGRRTAAAPSAPPLLLEEAALSQMLFLSAPDTEVQCLRDCLWAPLPASASRSLLLATNFLSWSASPEQPAPPALQICQVLSREGLPALYNL